MSRNILLRKSRPIRGASTFASSVISNLSSDQNRRATRLTQEFKGARIVSTRWRDDSVIIELDSNKELRLYARDGSIDWDIADIESVIDDSPYESSDERIQVQLPTTYDDSIIEFIITPDSTAAAIHNCEIVAVFATEFGLYVQLDSEFDLMLSAHHLVPSGEDFLFWRLNRDYK